MSLSRREFLRIMGGTAAAFTFPTVMLQGCKKALEKAAKRTPVIWLQAQSCSGCSVSLLNLYNFKPGFAGLGTVDNIASVITEFISLNYHQTLMGGTGDVAVSVLDDAVKKDRKDFVLIVEGSIPTKNDLYSTIGEINGKPVSAKQWVEELGKRAVAVVSVGTCSSFGGIPAAKDRFTNENPTGAVSVSEILKGKPVINIPGCPPHPEWMVGSLLYVLLKGEVPALDEQGRPKLFFGKTVHEQCERLKEYKKGVFARHWGDEGCLYQLGCLGMDSGCDIPTRKWVDGANSCTECGAGCIGCTENVFPEYGKRGIFQHLNGNLDSVEPQIREAVLNLKKGGVING